MSQTPNQFPGPRREEEYQCYLTGSTSGMITGSTRYVSGDFQMRDQVGVFNPRDGIPAATSLGQVLFSIDGASFTVQQPVCGPGWLASDDGILIVSG